MRVKVVLFAALAQRFNRRDEELDLPPGATAADLFDHYRRQAPDIGELGRSILLAVNQQFCPPETTLHNGDEVALLPPMSGGAGPLIETALVREPIGAWVPPPTGAYGGVVVFEGVVRNHSHGREVLRLEYEAYESMAEARLQLLAAEAAARWKLDAVRIVHRLGRLEVGEVSVQVVAAAAHRAAAFEACRWAIDTLKQSAPIWKKEFFADGEAWADGEFPATP